MNYNERIRILRERAELTQTDVAKKLGTSQSYYAQYERGERPLTFDRAIELAILFGTSLDYIGGLNDNINRKW